LQPLTKWVSETEVGELKKLKTEYGDRGIKTRIISKRIFRDSHSRKQKVYALEILREE